jgi:hypothetical protein
MTWSNPMSAASIVSKAPRAKNDNSPDAVEIVGAMSSEDKEDVLVYLIRELIAANGGKGLVPLDDPAGEFLGYFIPPLAAKDLAERQWDGMSLEARERLGRNVTDLDRCLSAEEMLDHLRRATAPTGQ